MESTPTSSWESHCPKPEKLAAFHRGVLPPEDVPSVANHLARCPRCKAQLEAWLAADTFSLKAPYAAPPTASYLEPQPSCPDDGTQAGAGSSSDSIPIAPTVAALTPTPLPPHLGVYELLAKLGQGGMGAVYKAWHTRLKRAVALKTLSPDRLHDAEAVGRFNREMEAVGKLDHPNIVRATDAGEINGVHFLVMEYVEGVDLAELLRRRGPLPIADACALAYQTAVGLQYVHENGLVHRDVKPSNLMLTPAGQLKILDLGLALLYEIPTAGEELTGSRQLMGTVDYMAPEQSVDAHDVDIRADIYSLGCTLYKLLTDHVPFGGPSYNTPIKKAMAHAHAPPPPLRNYRPDVPQTLVGIVERMMAKAPARRFASPGEAADKLRPFTATANLPQLLATAREQAIQRHGDGQTPPVGVKGSKTSGREAGPSSRTGPSSLSRVLLTVGTSPWVRYIVLAAVLMALTGAGVFWATRSWTNSPTPSVLAPDAASRRPFIPGTWHNVLDRQPVPLLWWRQDFPPQLDFDKQKLLVSSSATGLLVLGATPSAGYQYQLGISQPRPWTGGVGLFFGCHKEVVDGTPCLTYQSIQLMSRGPGFDKSQAFRLLRMKGTIFQPAGGGRSPGTSILKEQLLPAPNDLEQILEIVVNAPGRLSKVRWGGREMPDLVSSQVNAFFKDSDYVGEFGTVNVNSSCVFANAQIMLYEKEE